jgi:hypothetical protein
MSLGDETGRGLFTGETYRVRATAGRREAEAEAPPRSRRGRGGGDGPYSCAGGVLCVFVLFAAVGWALSLSLWLFYGITNAHGTRPAPDDRACPRIPSFPTRSHRICLPSACACVITVRSSQFPSQSITTESTDIPRLHVVRQRSDLMERSHRNGQPPSGRIAGGGVPWQWKK